MELPGFLVEEFGMHEWCQVVEHRSYDSMRPIHSQIMGLARLRMVQLAKMISRTLGKTTSAKQRRMPGTSAVQPKSVRS